MDESNIMKLMASEDELVGGDYIQPFRTNKISVISFITFEDLWHLIVKMCCIYVGIWYVRWLTSMGV